MDKQFFWKDLSGRGFTNTFTEEELKEAFKDEIEEEDEDDYDNGDGLRCWIETADVGDEYTEDPANKITRIK